MALKEGDDLSDDDVVLVEVENPEDELAETEEKNEDSLDQTEVTGEPEVVEGTGLTETKLEEHNEVMGGEVQGSSFNGFLANAVAPGVAGSEVNTGIGAGVVFGLPGLLIGGPILGLLTGVGAFFVSTKDEGPAGDVARGAGEFAVTTGSKVEDAAKEANEKHGILDKIKEAFTTGWGKVKELDEEAKISEKVKETAGVVKDKTVEFEQKHHVMANILEGINNFTSNMLENLKGCDGEKNDTTTGDDTATEEKNDTSTGDKITS